MIHHLSPRRLCLLLLVLAAGIGVYSKPLTPDQALTRAMGARAFRAPGSQNALTLRYTATDSVDQAAGVYIFANGSYTIAVAADDAGVPLLGYMTGDFNPDSIPDEMKWWLSQYANEIAWAADNGITSFSADRPYKEPIAPLSHTGWSQGSPYNLLCPYLNGKQCYVGCVATAMAQVMNYHQWPPKGTGQHSYEAWTIGETLSFDYENTTFDWNKLRDHFYVDSTPQDRKNEIAKLMYACAVAVDMRFMGESGSGASAFNVAAAMVNYFNYDKGIRFAKRNYFELLDWEDFVYDQLANFGPVQYSGQSGDGGHSFICDGYSEDGYFHINWGWGNSSDGYFLLTALDPETQGIGGSSSGYNYDQSIIANVQPPVEGSKIYENMMMSSLRIAKTDAIAGEYVKVYGLASNYSIGPVSGQFGLKLVNTSDGSTYYLNGDKFTNLQPNRSWGSYNVALTSDIPSGIYVTTPAFINSESQWQDIPVAITAVHALYTKIDGNKYHFSPQTVGRLEADSIQVMPKLYLGTKFRLTANITNIGEAEFFGNIQPILVDTLGTTMMKGDTYMVDLSSKDSKPMEYTGQLNNYNTTRASYNGQYYLKLVETSSGHALADPIPVELCPEPENVELSASNFKIIGDDRNVRLDNVKFETTVTCNEGYFADALSVAIFPATPGDGPTLPYLSTDEVFIDKGQSATTTAEGPLSHGQSGKEYLAAVMHGENQISPMLPFKTAVVTGICNPVECDPIKIDPTSAEGIFSISGDKINTIEVFSIDGQRKLLCRDSNQLDLSAQPKGAYIVRIEADNGSQFAARLIR